MKKTLATILALVMILTLAACGGGSGGGAGGGGTAAQGEPEWVLVLGDALAETHPHSQAYFWFADRVYELTDGNVRVDVFVGGVLGSQAEMVEGLFLGTVHIAKTMATGLAVYEPAIQIFDLPYMFHSREHFFRVLDGEVGDYIATEMLAPHDLIGISYFYAGTRSIYATTPIHTLADVQGLVLRVPGSPIFMAAMEAFGAAGMPMALGEIYAATQTGVIDGAENAPVFFYQQRHFEVTPYFIFTNHIMTPDIVIMNRTFLESMPQAYQDAILQAAREMTLLVRELWFELEEEVLASLTEAGITFIHPDLAPFMEAGQVVWDDYRDIVGQDMIDRIQALS